MWTLPVKQSMPARIETHRLVQACTDAMHHKIVGR